MFVGILLPEDLDSKDEEDFYSILKHHTEIRIQELSPQMSREEREHLSRKIGDFLMRGCFLTFVGLFSLGNIWDVQFE